MDRVTLKVLTLFPAVDLLFIKEFRRTTIQSGNQATLFSSLSATAKSIYSSLYLQCAKWWLTTACRYCRTRRMFLSCRAAKCSLMSHLVSEIYSFHQQCVSSDNYSSNVVRWRRADTRLQTLQNYYFFPSRSSKLLLFFSLSFIHARLTVFNFFVEKNWWSVNLIVWAGNNVQMKQRLQLRACRPATGRCNYPLFKLDKTVSATRCQEAKLNF